MKIPRRSCGIGETQGRFPQPLPRRRRPTTASPADAWPGLSVCVVLLSCGALFWQLGHYSLWGDESNTALIGRGVARTGDTMALNDHNLYVFRNGATLRNLRSRYEPPGQYYLAAPFIGVRGEGSWWPRIPFAICGLGSVLFALYWMSRCRLSTAMWVVFSVALLANVSFFLYCRQCRYYSLSLLLSLVIVYQYLNWNGKYSGIGWMLVPSAMLLWVHYFQYAALYAILACDYLLFARHRRKLTAGQWLLLVVPQVLIGIAATWTYNPLGADVVQNSTFQRIPILDKLTLVWWNFRDLDKCEFCVGLVMLAAPLVYCCTRNVWILRAPSPGLFIPPLFRSSLHSRWPSPKWPTSATWCP